MALNFKTPSQVAADYLTILKSVKTDVNINQQDSDWWIRSRVVGGLLSGIYADQQLVSNDAFPQSARHDALEAHLFTYLNRGFNPATQSVGQFAVTGNIGSVIGIGMEFVYGANGNTYQATEGQTLAATAVLVPVISVAAGQAQNLLSGAEVTISSPPAGINPTAVASGNIADGSDAETDPEAAAAILERIRNPLSGGTRSDYLQWAQDSSPSVVSANIIRYYAGLGTVGVVVTAGTNDIDAAINQGQPVVLIPTDALLATVSGYIEARKPLTDCVTYLKPASAGQDVTVRVKFASGDSNTILSGQTLTQAELVEREVKRAIYKHPPGGYTLGASGYVVSSAIEETIDAALSNGVTIGTLPILLDRQVDNLSSSGANRALFPTEVALPGTITVVEI